MNIDRTTKFPTRKVVISGHPQFHFGLESETIRDLVECAGRHYDGTCKLLTVPGGFLRGWDTRREFTEGPGLVQLQATWYELDQASKVAEAADYLGDPVKTKRIAAFRMLVGQMMAVARSQQWTVEFEVAL